MEGGRDREGRGKGMAGGENGVRRMKMEPAEVVEWWLLMVKAWRREAVVRSWREG